MEAEQNKIHPKGESVEFTSYKEKVLYIIKKIRKQFGKSIHLRQPNFDLSWCAFVIENDYLQISNSISTSQFQMIKFSKQSTSDMDKEEVKKMKEASKEKNRRFSKTINSNFGQRNKKQIENMVVKKMLKISEQLVKGEVVESDSVELKGYNDYFFTNNYNAFGINKAVDGNILTFNLIYLYQKFDWKNKLPLIDEQVYKNMAYRLQKSYRDNIYHSSVHAADVANHLAFLLQSCEVNDICQLSDVD